MPTSSILWRHLSTHMNIYIEEAQIMPCDSPLSNLRDDLGGTGGASGAGVICLVCFLGAMFNML